MKDSETQHAASTFHVGITMAGAGSAGCYTGGVMDYLFEILDLWEKAKKKNLPGYEEFYSLVPDHDVVIDVMGGTSAGGMTTIMSAIYALNGAVNPVKDPHITGGKRNNIFYDSWVMLDDDVEDSAQTTLAKAWSIDDLQENKFVSLLNTKIIDNIADSALNVEGDLQNQTQKLPGYISKDIDVLLAHTMLRGIPLAINFSTPIGQVKGVNDLPEHITFEHFTVSHYKLNEGTQPDPGQFLWLNPYQKPYKDIINLTTKATGAFPLGLKFRQIDKDTFSDDYLKCVTRTIVSNRFGQLDQGDKISLDNFPSPFNFVTIDGGAINNEPFGEVLGILKSRYPLGATNGYPTYGIVMIDPLPDVIDKREVYKAPDDLFTVVPAIIKTLHEQSKVKRADIIEAADHPYFRGEIFPRKWIDRKKDENPIASASAFAFGGFLDIRFRHYDFFLGRDNARNYLRYYFSFEYTEDPVNPAKSIIHPIHRNWTKEMIAVFKITGKDGKTYLPIIPDLNILQEIKRTGKKKSPFDYSIKDKPVYDPSVLFDMRRMMRRRFEKLLDITKLKLVHTAAATKNEETHKWMERYYRKSIKRFVSGWLIGKGFNVIFSLTKRSMARKVTEATIRWILSDLEQRGFLKKWK
jgi:hypothetical protein